MSQSGTIARNTLNHVHSHVCHDDNRTLHQLCIVSSGLPSRVIRKLGELFILLERWLIKYRIICKFLRYYKYE